MLCPDSLHQILGLVRLIIQALGDWGLLTKFFKSDLQFQIHVHQDLFDTRVVGGGGGMGELLGLIFTGYLPLASQNPYPIIVYSVAKYRPHLRHFWETVIFAIPSLLKKRLFILLVFQINSYWFVRASSIKVAHQRRNQGR